MAPGVYLYCIGHKAELTPERVRSISATPADGSDAAFRLVESESLVALVSDTEVPQFEIQRDSLMAHHRVLEEVMGFADILPVSYGTVAGSDDDIINELLIGTGDQLRANLSHVEGKVELTLRVMWHEGQLFQEVVDEVPEIRQLRDSLIGVPEDASYYERIRLGEMTSQAIMSKNEAERELLLEPLVALSADVEVASSTSDSLILNAAFLVDRQQQDEFDQAVQELGRTRQERMTFRYLGPLPPASFVSVVVNASG